MNHLTDYSLKALNKLSLEDFNNHQSPIKRKAPQYYFYGVVGTKSVEYSEKGNVFKGVYADVNINGWYQVSRTEYMTYNEQPRLISGHKDIHDSKMECVEYQNQLLNDFNVTKKELLFKKSVKKYDDLIIIVENIIQLSFEYSQELYALQDKYDISFLEDKALYFDEIANSMREELKVAKEERELFKKMNLKSKKDRELKKLLAEKERLEKSIQQLNTTI